MNFSFIIPAKNEGISLSFCIRSILSQDYDSGFKEIIVIDDYSTDNTVELAKGLGALVITPNLPIGKTSRAQNKNLAMQFSHGEYLVFLDAHVKLPSPDWLRRVASIIVERRSENNLFLASFPALPPPELTLLLNLFSAEDVKTISLSVAHVRGSNQFIGGSMIVSKEAFQALGGFPLIPVSEDIGFYKRSISYSIDYIFISELWVWHLDKKLRSVKNWLKRSIKEGYFSTAYSWSYSDVFGKIYSGLIAASLIIGFFSPIVWTTFFLLLCGLLFLQSYRAFRAMRLSNGKIGLSQLVILITLQSVQAVVMRISAVVGIPTYLYRRFKSWWYKWIKKLK